MDAIAAHRSTDLRYRLLAGPTDLAPLKVLACRSFGWAGWEVRAVILGASHAMVFRRGGDERAELLTCLPPPEKSRGTTRMRVDVPTLGKQSHCLPPDWLPGAAGTLQLSRFPLANGDALLGAFVPENTLSWDFPALSDVAGTPRTRIGWRSDATQLVIETVHTYPEESWGIRSETRLVVAIP